MPRTIAPDTWATYVRLLREGWSREAAARKVGVSRQSARAFLAGNSASARRWRQIRAGQACPLCGCDNPHAGED